MRGVSFTTDGNHVLSVGADNKMHRWEADGGKKIAEVSLAGEAYKLNRGPDFIIAGASDKLLHRIDLTKNQESLKFAGHADWVLSSAVHPKNNQLISGSIDGELRLWNVADATLLRTGAPHHKLPYRDGWGLPSILRNGWRLFFLWPFVSQNLSLNFAQFILHRMH